MGATLKLTKETFLAIQRGTHSNASESELEVLSPVCPKMERPHFSGFTYIEVLLTLAILAILFVPTMQLFAHAMEATRTSRDLITAVSLARWEMERVKNIGVSTQRLKETGNIIWPPETEEPVQLNGRGWRIYRDIKEGTEPLEVAVEVKADKDLKPMVRLVTLITDTSWGEQVTQ